MNLANPRLLMVCVIGLWCLLNAKAEALINLDAANFAGKSLVQWPNQGSIEGTFESSAQQFRVVKKQGRSGVVFTSNETFSSSVALPSSLVAQQGFTVEAWVLNPEVDRVETIASLLVNKTNSIEFNYGTNSDNGAFFAGRKAWARFHPVPEADAWHHLAWTFAGGSNGILHIYVDGELATRQECSLPRGRDLRLLLGASRHTTGAKPQRPFSGLLATVQVHNVALTYLEVRRAAGQFSAFNPEPADGSTTDTLSTRLGWQRGDANAKLYRVYFSPTRAEVEKRQKSTLKQELPADKLETTSISLAVGQIYFWCVEQLDAEGKLLQPCRVWRLTADPGLAGIPEPRNRTANVPVTIPQLKWQPGKYATKQRLFFGTDPEHVRKSTKPALDYLATTTTECAIPVPALKPGTRYYWRVDSDNGEQPPSKGEVWAFRTQDVIRTNDVTFFIASDLHYDLSEGMREANRLTLEAMNWLPGEKYPAAAGGGIVRTPRGVLLNGDLIDQAKEPEALESLASFMRDYGVNGEGRLCYPVYEGLGNHDWGSLDSPVVQKIIDRNLRRPGINGKSDNGLHYAFDLGFVHFVCLNLFPGVKTEASMVTRGGGPLNSITFLTNDLAWQVGGSGRPVVLYHHLGLDKSWWNKAQQAAYFEAIKTYNVAAIIYGHTHAAGFSSWDGQAVKRIAEKSTDTSSGITLINDAAAHRGPYQPGEFFVVRITNKELIAAQRFVNRWGMVLRQKLPRTAQ